MQDAERHVSNHCLDHHDSEHWPAFVRLHHRRIRGLLCRALRRRGAPVTDEGLEELTQEVYCRLLTAGRGRRKKLSQRSARTVACYLTRVADTAVADFLRRNANRWRLLQVARYHRRVAVSLQQHPEHRLLARERLELFLARCRHHLGPEHNELRLRAIQLAVLEGWSSRDVARWSRDRLRPRQIDSMVHRMRRKLARDGITIGRRGSCTVLGTLRRPVP